jgi:nucleoporin NUP82
MRLSPALLDVMSSAHRTISSQTAKLETAATELFRRCERLREELGEQVKQMSELADKLHKLQDSGDEDLRPGEERLTQDRRLERAREKQLGLDKRFDDLRRKVAKVGSGRRELSQKEKAWIEEVSGIGMKVCVGVDGADGDSRARESLESRVQTVSFNLDHYEIDTMLTWDQVKALREQLLEEAKRLQDTQKSKENEDLANSKSSFASGSSSGRRSPGFLVSSKYQKERIAEVMNMVEREGAVIDAVTRRLDALKVDIAWRQGLGAMTG